MTNDDWSVENMMELVSQANADIQAMHMALNKALIASGWQREFMFHNLVLWAKKLPDGRTVLVERDTAARIEEYLHSYEANQ